MKNNYHGNQSSLLSQAIYLLEQGQDCGIIAGKLDPEYAMRLRIHTQMLPDEIRKKSIYGRAHAPTYTKKKK
jgi:hypothetical protein